MEQLENNAARQEIRRDISEGAEAGREAYEKLSENDRRAVERISQKLKEAPETVSGADLNAMLVAVKDTGGDYGKVLRHVRRLMESDAGEEFPLKRAAQVTVVEFLSGVTKGMINENE